METTQLPQELASARLLAPTIPTPILSTISALLFAPSDTTVLPSTADLASKPVPSATSQSTSPPTESALQSAMTAIGPTTSPAAATT